MQFEKHKTISSCSLTETISRSSAATNVTPNILVHFLHCREKLFPTLLSAGRSGLRFMFGIKGMKNGRENVRRLIFSYSNRVDYFGKATVALVGKQLLTVKLWRRIYWMGRTMLLWCGAVSVHFPVHLQSYIFPDYALSICSLKRLWCDNYHTC